jgi:hypothetical protein
LVVIEESESAEISKLARFCISRLEKTYENGSRIVLPNEDEIEHMKALKPFPVKVFTLSGSSLIIFVESFSNANDLKISLMKRIKIPMSKFCRFGLFEIWQDGEFNERYIEDNELVMDLVSSWTGRTGGYKILLKLRFVMETNSKDPLLPFVYMQSVFDILKGLQKYSEKVLTILASLKLFCDMGKGRMVENILQDNLHFYIPANSTKDLPDTQKLISKILKHYNSLSDYSKAQAQARYVELASKSPLVGCTLFYLSFHEASGRYALPKEVLLSINSSNVIFYSTISKRELMKFDYSQISSWGASTDRLAVFVSISGYQVEFLFKTLQSQVITSLLKGYTSLILNQPIDNHLSPAHKAREIGLSRVLATKFPPLPMKIFK